MTKKVKGTTEKSKEEPKKNPVKEKNNEPFRETETPPPSIFPNDLNTEKEISLVESGSVQENQHAEPNENPAKEKQSNEHFDRT